MVQWFGRAGCGQSRRGRDALGAGDLSNVKGVGGGIFEYRVDFGPGFRIYFGKDGERLVILLGGGTKKRQQRDINDAIARWQDYRRRKTQE